ncbi:hypothetical protein DFJ74DRAFT_609203 [Hyaloraphidium curvatum]|nr:hypothetical protein DFJ74DRAFT_609203 [Hyaloraphidium curvatum]
MAPPAQSSGAAAASPAGSSIHTAEGQKQFIHEYLDNTDVYPHFEAETKLAARVPSAAAKPHLDRLRAEGYTILRGLLSPAQVARVRKALDDMDHRKFGRNRFEGNRTVRVDSLVAKHVAFAGMVEHPAIMDIFDHILLPNYLMTLNQSIRIFPGERRQPLHYDDGPLRIRSKEYSPLTVSTMWAISPFTATNGATVLFPGSHLWDPDRLPDVDKDPWIQAIMEPGDVLLYIGTVWHAGGANVDPEGSPERLGVTIQYTQPFLRTVANSFLVVHPKDVLKMSPRLQVLLGYGMHSPNYGHFDGRHPIRALSEEGGGTMNWFKQVDDGLGPLDGSSAKL